MVTTFNKKDLRSFHNYMISDRRREFYKTHVPMKNMPPLEDRLKEVNDGDIERWMKWELAKKRGK